ncbi:MAG: GIY-YIG nuclease family protein [Candidatus Riflebacteria bacterium]|nr:GIY-YIG nuclease family protein [Candidatus Riflebacteria bacterium]
MYGYIYKISTTKSNKVNIGQTTKTVEERYQLHLGARNSRSKKTLHLYLAMKKYGIETFSVEQIDNAETREELNEKEKYWIEYYDSINNGYNMMPGGNDENPMNSDLVKEKHDNKMRSKEVRDKISKTMSELRLTKGFSEEHKQKIKASREKRKQERAALGLSFYDHPEHMASRSITVYCILFTTGEEYEFSSIKEAGKWWFENYKPFGEIYSIATYQRKIEASIAGKKIAYGCPTHKNYKVITNIAWFRKEGDA